MKQKRVLLLGIVFLLLLLQNNLQAQEYIPFPTSDAIWSEVFTSEQPFEIETYQHGLSGDTMINSELYHKIYRLNDTVYPLVLGEYCGAIREDNSKRIFVVGCNCAYPGSGENEVLLYDFSKSIGDTVFVGIDGSGPEGYLVIDLIDSVLIENNYRKTFHFTTLQDYYWIEGIGSTRGLFSPIQTQPTGQQKWKLICFNLDGEVIYLNPEFNTCFPVLTGINSNKKKSDIIKIFPNPVTSISVIEFMNYTNDKYQNLDLYDVFGQQVNHINITDKKQIVIKKSDYKPGIYIFHISGPNMKPETGKIIIK